MFRGRIFCRTLSLFCTLLFGVFSGQHIFHQFRQQTFFFAHIFKKLFFSDFCGDKLFFSIFFLPPPPPDIKWCVPKQFTNHTDLRYKHGHIGGLHIRLPTRNLAVISSDRMSESKAESD